MGIGSFLPPCESRDGIRIVRLGSKCLPCLLSYLVKCECHFPECGHTFLFIDGKAAVWLDVSLSLHCLRLRDSVAVG